MVLLICKEHRRALLLERLYFYFGESVEFKWHYDLPKFYNRESVVLIDGYDFVKKHLFMMNSPFYNISEESNHLSAWEWHRALNFYSKRYVTGQILNNGGIKVQNLTSLLFHKNQIYLAIFLSVLFRFLVLRKLFFVRKEVGRIPLVADSYDDVYVFGTGESLKNFKVIDSNAAVIVCNTIVKNKALFTNLKPNVMVAGDALYHFSDELFSRKFQKDLKECLDQMPRTQFIYPQIFESFMLRTYAGANKGQLHSLPVLTEKKMTSIQRSGSLPRLGNSFNLLSFPIATFIARKNIFFIGYDGKSKTAKNFWKNNEDTFYSKEAEALLEKNKAFRKLFLDNQNYSQKVFGDKLEERMAEVEKTGINLVSLFPSNTEPFNKRYYGNQLDSYRSNET